MRVWFLSVMALSFTSCGYHVGTDNSIQSYGTISIPYVENDIDGGVTAALVKEVASNSCLEYRFDGGALTLSANVINCNDLNIGFRYDRHRSGKLQHTLIPDETRLTITVEFSIIEAASETVLLGPIQLSAYVDLDHDYNADLVPSDKQVNVESLGQLTNAEAAFEAAERPLNRAIARKIVDYLRHYW